MSALDQVVIVFHRPQDPVNIAGAVRVMKNMGIHDLRLVRPVAYDPWRIEGVAHGTRDVVERIRHFDTLQEALADCVYVAAFAGKRWSCLMRVNRSSWAAAMMSPPLTRAAALSW